MDERRSRVDQTIDERRSRVDRTIDERRYGGNQMMDERRRRVENRGRSPSPRRLPRRYSDFSPPRRRKNSPDRGNWAEKSSREVGRPRKIEKGDHVARVFDAGSQKFSVYDYRDRDRDRYVNGDKPLRSPRRIERMDLVSDRDSNLGARRFSVYDDRGRERDRYVAGSRRSRSPHRFGKKDQFDRNFHGHAVRLSEYGNGAEDRDKDGFPFGYCSRSNDGDSYRGDFSSKKFQCDSLLDRPRSSDQLDVKDYGKKCDYLGIGDTNNTKGSGERGYYLNSHYSDSSRAGLLSVPHCMDRMKPDSLEHDMGGRMHSDSYAFPHGGVDNVTRSNLSGGDGSSHVSALASRYLNTDIDRQPHFHFRDELHLEKRDGAVHDQEVRHPENKDGGFYFQDGLPGLERSGGKEIYKYKKDESFLPSRGYVKGDSDYFASSSQPKDYVSMGSGDLMSYSTAGEIHMPSNLIKSGSGMASEPIGFDGYRENRQNMSPRGLGGRLGGTGLYLSPPREKHGVQLYSAFGRSKIDSMSIRPSDAGQEYRDQHMSRIDVLDPLVDESPHQKQMKDDGVQEHYPYSRVRSTPNKVEAAGSLYIKQDLDMLGTGNSHLNYGTEEYRGYGSVKPEERRTEMDDHVWSHGGRSAILQSSEYGPCSEVFYDSPRKRSALAGMSLVEPSERMLSHERVRDEMYDQGVGIMISTDGNGARKIYNQVNAAEEMDHVSLSKKLNSIRSNYEKTWRGSSVANYRSSSSKFPPHHPVNHSKPDRDVKKRLGPVPRKLHVSQRLVKKYKPSIKKRLTPAQHKKHGALPWMKNLSSKRMLSIQDDSLGSPNDQDGDHSGDPLPLAKPEPPEKSEEFKQLVQSAFFKFLKQLNETTNKRKEYMERRKAGTFKCIACGSNSEEFVDTESLAMHAFTSEKVGLRSQHLGLHKALCLLIGWKIPEDLSNGWHCEVVSDAESSALKEDLIIWPPVVIVHNRTMDNKDPEKRGTVSTEKLDMKLRDMGFRNILKICSGKPANQSVMVVKFPGTLSGLQEAERLHNSYIEAKHGRPELEQMKSKNGATQLTQAEGEENVLYGYMGIAEDLEILDSDTTKRCVLRSKKEIMSIADAPLDPEEN